VLVNLSNKLTGWILGGIAHTSSVLRDSISKNHLWFGRVTRILYNTKIMDNLVLSTNKMEPRIRI